MFDIDAIPVTILSYAFNASVTVFPFWQATSRNLISSSLFYRLKTLTESSQVLFLKRKYNFFSEYANMMTAAESTDLFKAKPIVKTSV